MDGKSKVNRGNWNKTYPGFPELSLICLTPTPTILVTEIVISSIPLFRVSGSS